jgi:uncharacterized phage protein gp47/JayE
MNLSLQNFTTLVEQSAAAVQASASQLLDFTAGSVLRALLEANAALVLWLQWLVLLTLQTTRLSTSTGPDADSFGADFGFSRLAAVAASGSVTFGRYTATMTALVPVGTVVTTSDSTSEFAVTTDIANSAWSAVQSGYVIGSGVASVTVPVSSSVAGSAGNVLPGTISLIASAIPGVDTVTNANALSGGMDAESDAAFRARFQGFIDSRTRATLQAITYATMSLQQNVTCTVQENGDASGNYLPGHFIVTVDDGSGAPPAALLSSVQTAVDAVRPLGSTFAIQAPVLISANISLNLVTASSSNSSMAISAVNSAITAYVNTLAVGATLAYTRLAQLAYDASPSVANVNDLTLQGGTADLITGPGSVIKIGTLAIS